MEEGRLIFTTIEGPTLEELENKPILTPQEARMIESIKAYDDAVGEFANDAVHEYRKERAMFSISAHNDFVNPRKSPGGIWLSGKMRA